MDLTSLIGIIAGIGIILGTISLGGDLRSYLDLPSILIVFGGTLSAVLLSFSKEDFHNFFKLIKHIFKSKKQTDAEIIRHFIELSRKVKFEGYLSLRAFEKIEEDEFIRKGLALILDNVDQNFLVDTLNIELIAIKERHRTGQQMFAEMARYSPAFGLVGTLLGLVEMLKNLNDPSQMGPKMALAILTTFYGAVLANVFFNPMAFKLKKRSEAEIYYKSIIIQGLLALHEHVHPIHMEERLKGFLNTIEKNKLKHPPQNNKIKLID